jgi:tetratricopeptide (TPR) repeat protein
MKLPKAYIWLIACFLIGIASSCPGAQTAPTATQAQTDVAQAQDFFLDVLTARADMYWHDGDYNNCARILMLQTDIDPQWLEPYEHASWLLWSNKRYADSVAVLKKGITNNPNRFELYFELGDLYFRTARPGSIYRKRGAASTQLYKQAVVMLEKASSFQHPARVDHLLANIYGIQGRYNDEGKIWQKVLKKDPNDIVAKRHLDDLKKKGK